MQSLALAKVEKAKREKARRHLIDFTRYTMPEFEFNWHHEQICDALEAVERGEIKRLIIEAPPRHTKSELASRRFPSWYIGRHPNKQIITATYNSDFASDFGRDVRNIVNSEEYSKVFKVKLRSDSKAANRWHTDKNGIYVSAGVGAGLTGKGAHIALIDDPFKDRKEADNEGVRQGIWEWYTSVLLTRLMPGAAVIVIATRWHEDDLTGRILEKAKETGEEWVELKYPAITDGKALWQKWYGFDYLQTLKSTIGLREWSALYQQSPTTDDGTFYTRDMFTKRWTTLPANLEYYVGADYATMVDDGDYTEQGVFGVDENRYIYVTDWFSGQVTSKTWLRTLFEFVKKYKINWHSAEPGTIRRMSEEPIKDKMVDESAYFGLKWIGGGNSKQANAYSFKNLCEQGRVIWPKDNDVTERVIEQLIKGLGGKYDDAWDACSCFGLEITKAWAANPPKPKESPKQSKDQFLAGLELTPKRTKKKAW